MLFIEFTIDIRCSSYAGSKKLEEEMRELMTPTLGGTNKLSASFKAANGNGVARQAASKIMEPTKAYTASKRPSIPYVKKESRWGPRYVLRKPSEYTAFNTVKAVPAAEEKPAVMEEKPAVMEEKPAVTEEKPAVEVKPTAMEVKSTEEKPVAAEKPAMTEEKPTVAEETEEVPTPESSEGVARKESISTSPEHVASLPGEREEEGKKRQPEGSFCILF